MYVNSVNKENIKENTHALVVHGYLSVRHCYGHVTGSAAQTLALPLGSPAGYHFVR